MNRHHTLFLSVIISVALALLPIFPAFAQEKQDGQEDLEKTKAVILEDIETLVQGLKKTRGCVSEAKNAYELEICREEVKIKKYQELDSMLLEMGMTREEREAKRAPRGQ